MPATIEELKTAMQQRLQEETQAYPAMSLMPQEGENIMLQLDPAWTKTEESRRRLVEKVMLPAIEGIGAKIIATILPSPDSQIEKITLTIIDSFQVESWSTPKHNIGAWECDTEEQLKNPDLELLQQTLRDSSGKTNPDFITLLEEQTNGPLTEEQQ